MKVSLCVIFWESVIFVVFVRTSKRPRHDNGSDIGSAAEEAPLDLLALYQSDVGSRILSYASSVELCALDILSKQFNALTTDQWRVVTKDRFGISNGKEGWRVGISFLRPPIPIHIRDEHQDSAPHVAANESIIATTNSIAIGVEIRDAYNFEYIRQTSATDNYTWGITLCGRIGSEIIITSGYSRTNKSLISAQQGNIVQSWQYNKRCTNGIPSIGCENHLIVTYDGRIQVFEVNHDAPLGNKTELLSLRNEVEVDRGVVDVFGHLGEVIVWGPDKRHFVVGGPHQICVWKFDAVAHRISLTKTIAVNEFEVRNVALADDYIVASSMDKKLLIWDRITGLKMTYVRSSFLCNDDEDSIDEEDYVYAPSLSCHGHLLVSSNHLGCAICIWDMKTGKLLKRHEHPDKEDIIEERSECAEMIYLKHNNTFLCMRYDCMEALAFPPSQRQTDNAISRRQSHNSEDDSDRYMDVVDTHILRYHR